MNNNKRFDEEHRIDRENYLNDYGNEAETIVCPVCGGQNPVDAVFCDTPSCHKALGEFKYVLEEIGARKNCLERLADRVAQFVSKPHFIIFHVIWFTVWILVNQGYLGIFSGFDSYPYDLLSFILAIEAILVTGFLLISQNYQYEYAEKRAELDYEINIRAYRKLLELEKSVEDLAAKIVEPEPTKTR